MKCLYDFIFSVIIVNVLLEWVLGTNGIPEIKFDDGMKLRNNLDNRGWNEVSEISALAPTLGQLWEIKWNRNKYKVPLSSQKRKKKGALRGTWNTHENF